MANAYFQFKQFIVQQNNTAMKVCTDACLFGAWIANKIESERIQIESIADIGTGTGLLSLMLAQKTNALIRAIEIDESAAQRAAANFEVSPWKERLSILPADVRTVNLPEGFDLVISNPPFYQNDLRSLDKQRNYALHSEALSFEELIVSAKKLLKSSGFFAVLLPFHRITSFKQLAAANNLFLIQETLVKQTEKHDYFRSMLLFNTNNKVAAVNGSQIIIKENGQYSKDFTALLKDYYLYL